MTRKAALAFINKRAETVTWKELAHEVGETPEVVYGWWRRQSVPKWRVEAIAAAAEKLQGVT